MYIYTYILHVNTYIYVFLCIILYTYQLLELLHRQGKLVFSVLDLKIWS